MHQLTGALNNEAALTTALGRLLLQKHQLLDLRILRTRYDLTSFHRQQNYNKSNA